MSGCWGLAGRSGEWPPSGAGFLWGMMNVQKLGSGGGCTTLWICYKTLDLHLKNSTWTSEKRLSKTDPYPPSCPIACQRWTPPSDSESKRWLSFYRWRGLASFADFGGHEGAEPLGRLPWNLCRMSTGPGVHTLEFSVVQLSSGWQVRPSLDLSFLIWEEITSCFYIFWPAGMWKENELKKKMVKAVHKVKKCSNNSIFLNEVTFIYINLTVLNNSMAFHAFTMLIAVFLK